MRALVVGYGRMGGFHAKVLRDLGYEVVTVDRDPSRGADRLKPKPFDRFEVACVATPIDTLPHVAAATATVARPEFMLVEKPFAPTSALGRETAAALDGYCGRVAVGYVERFNPQVRALKQRLVDRDVLSATFTRWNTRPSLDIELDLRSHDLDLAQHLGIRTFAAVARASAETMVRAIEVTDAMGMVDTADLTAHNTSPLHAMWHAFLSDRSGYATPEDAIHVLEQVEGSVRLEAAAA